MAQPFKLIVGACALVVLMIGGLYAYRSLMVYEGRTPEGYQLLTVVPGASGFEPKALPAGPILENQSAGDLAVNFGYEVAGVPYSYSLALVLPAKSERGRATLTVRHSTRSASIEADVVRRWDEPRKAYAIALQDDFHTEPSVPSLCLKAVLGPSNTRYDLRAGSLCIAQRDGYGLCHPETLACGQIR